MHLKDYKYFFTQELASIYPITEVDTFFFILMEEYLNFQRVDIVLKSDFMISKNQLTLLNKALNRLKKEEPIQYILGKTDFYGLSFLVDKHTLIPRQETEELVEWILNETKNNTSETLSILDIGTGTGCIPITLAKHLPNANINTIDVSEKAIHIAQQNALLNNVFIHFSQKNILETKKLNKEFNYIVSNPPYVRELEKVEIRKNVLENEPHLALFVSDDNPLIFYKKIADLAKNHLTKKGVLFFEINQYLGKETVLMLEKKGFSSIELRKDLSGNDRMIKAVLI